VAEASEGRRSSADTAAPPLPSIPLVAVRTNVLEPGATASGGAGTGAGAVEDTGRSVPPLLPLPTSTAPPASASAPSAGPSTAAYRRAIFRQPNGSFFAYVASGAAVRVYLPKGSSNRATTTTTTPLQPPAGGWAALQARADDPQRLLFLRVRIYWPLVSARRSE
jgi:hypothetical protein